MLFWLFLFFPPYVILLTMDVKYIWVNQQLLSSTASFVYWPHMRTLGITLLVLSNQNTPCYLNERVSEEFESSFYAWYTYGTPPSAGNNPVTEPSDNGTPRYQNKLSLS